MANEAWTWILRELPRAVAQESPAVRAESSSNAARAVTADAVALDVAANAGGKISLGFERVVTPRFRRIAPDGFWRMESSAVSKGDRSAQRDADALMAGEAKALFGMARRTLRRSEARVGGVHREVVAGMGTHGTRTSVMARHTEVFGMAIRTEGGVVARDPFVLLNEIGGMGGIA